MTPKEYVLAQAPNAICFGPVKIHWPSSGDRTKYVVTLASHLSSHAGEGDTEDEAWSVAARHMKMRKSPELVLKLNVHAEKCLQCSTAKKMNSTKDVCEIGQKIIDEMTTF